jgi:lysozyme
VKYPDHKLPWPIDLEAVRLIAEFEGCRLQAYRCPAGKWTCGWGETDGVGPDTVWTQEYADQRFCDSLTDYTEKVRDKLTREASGSQLGAMVSLAYNIGVTAFGRSTVLRAHNAGDFEAASRAFGLWNKARVNGALTELKGLTRRRAAESALYLRDEAQDRMPQAVEAESPISKSPIQQSGAVTVATGVGTILASVADPFAGYVSKMAGMAKDVGLDPLLLVGTVLAVAGATVMYWRWKQRRGGWS